MHENLKRPETPGDGHSTPAAVPASVIERSRLKAPAGLHPDASLVLRMMPMPADTNPIGGIFGGWIMAQVDIAGAVQPVRIARGRVTTVAVNHFTFKQPVSVGDLLSFYSRIERIGTTSITVHVEVYAERNPATPEVVKVTEASLTYVAIDADGRPRAVVVDLGADARGEAARDD
jgi:acyl-CoA thioesterase YciA